MYSFYTYQYQEDNESKLHTFLETLNMRSAISNKKQYNFFKKGNSQYTTACESKKENKKY